MSKRDEILEKLDRIDEIPIPMGIFNEFEKAIDRGADFGQLSKIIRKDPALAMKILKTANSLAFNLHPDLTKSL